MSGILLASVGNSYGSLPINIVAPAVTGTATVGQTLSTTNGTWTGAPAPTFTYQWQRNSVDISGATSSTYVLVAADAGNPIRCVVTATNSVGSASANSNATANVALAPGQVFGGGFFAGQISTSGNGIPTHNLVICPRSSGAASRQWKTIGTDTPGTDSVIDGPGNTAVMNNATHPAAQFCAGLSVGGFSDWYFPAINEFEVCYFNLKPTTGSNNTGFGTNTNAVPSRGSNYTATVPGRTSATDFQSPSGTESFDISIPDSHWVSTQYTPDPGQGRSLSPVNGFQGFGNKSASRKLRAVRRVSV